MRSLLIVVMFFFVGIASAQGTKTVAVRVSDQTVTMNNKEYYIHIVEQGQTVFSIARAYGLKYYDAVIKTDIHLLKVGDTVWLPKNEYSVAAVLNNASAVVSPANQTHYVKVEAGQTLYALSREYGVTVEQIIEANPELRSEQLKAGQMLVIPPRSGSTKAAESAKKEEPTAKAKKEEPSKASESAKAAEPTKKDEPAKKEEPTSATKKDNSAKSAEPTKSAEPAKKEEPASGANNSASAGTVKAEMTDNAATPTENASTPLRRPIANPYPFPEVPGDFPAAKAPFLNFTTPSSYGFQVRDRQSKDKVYVSVFMPLNLEKLDEISTSKFDIEQRGKKDYKAFEFVQFYEGILMALDKLQSQGISVVLNVVDVASDKDEDIVEAYKSHNVAGSDFIIALLVKKPFAKLAELAAQDQIFVINPFSSRADVVKDNPYVVKYMPSTEGMVKGILDIMSAKHKGGNLYIIYSNGKSLSATEKALRDEFQTQLERRNDIKYTFFDWTANSKLLNTLKTTNDNVIVSIYDQGQSKNTVFATTLLNRLSLLTTHVPTLITVDNYLTQFPNVDFDQLQHLNYTTLTLGYLDYGNTKHKDFIDTYKELFRTEPNTLYAGVSYDIMLYFTTALWQQGAEFWRNPQKFVTPDALLFPFGLKQSSTTGGYENQYPDIYQMINYKMLKIN